MLSIGKFVDELFNGQVVMRQFPCGPEAADCNIVGLLSRSPGFLQDDAEAIAAKYGYGLSNWTVVSQVAKVPIEETIDTFVNSARIL